MSTDVALKQFVSGVVLGSLIVGAAAVLHLIAVGAVVVKFDDGQLSLARIGTPAAATQWRFGPGWSSVVSDAAAPAKQLRLGGLDFERAALAWFALAAALALAIRRQVAQAHSDLAAALRYLSIVGLASTLWATVHSVRSWNVIVVQGAIAGIAVVTIFIVASANSPSTSGPLSVLRALRHIAKRPVSGLFSAVALVMLFVPDRLLSATDGFESQYPERHRVVSLVQQEFPIQIIRFIDYECPPCKRSASEYRSLLTRLSAEFPGRIEIRTLAYPLESGCNIHHPKDLHASACEAAAAVRLASAEGVADEMESWLWENQETLSRDAIFNALRRITGLADPVRQYPEALSKVTHDVELAASLGVKGTPTFFINGTKLGYVSARKFEWAVRYEIGAVERIRLEKP